MVKFNIVLPTYNRPDYVVRSVKSIINQNYDNYHLYIYNDGSTLNYDDLEDLVRDNPKITYVKMETNRGINKIRNDFIDLIYKNEKGSYFFTLSDDDYLINDALVIMSDFILNSKASWYCFNVYSNSKENFLNIHYEDENKITYKEFLKNYRGDKHFVFNINLFKEIRYPQLFKNGHEDILYHKVARKTDILVSKYSVKVIEYMDDGLTVMSIKKGVSYSDRLRIRWNYVCEDKKNINYIFRFLKGFFKFKGFFKSLYK